MIVLEDEAQAVTTRPCGHWGRHPIDTLWSKSSPLQRNPCTAAGTTANIMALTPSPNLNQWPFTASLTGSNRHKLQGERSGLWGHQFNNFQQKHSTWSTVHAPQSEQTPLCSTVCWQQCQHLSIRCTGSCWGPPVNQLSWLPVTE